MYSAYIVLLGCVVVLGAPSIKDKTQNKIFGGWPANIRQFKYQVSIIGAINYNGYIAPSPICGGSIISEKFVVTAAHCIARTVYVTNPLGVEVEVKVEGFSIRAGSEQNDRGGVEIKVSNQTPHPDYQRDKDVFDIAVLELYEKLAFSDTVGAIALPAVMEFPRPGQEAWVSGWGRTPSGSGSAYLLCTVIPIQSIESTPSGPIIIAGVKGFGGCFGDSGGPLVVNGVLQGIVHGGRECGVGADIYCSVGYLRDFIHSIANV